MKLTNYLKRISEVPFSERQNVIETITIQSYGSNILTETDMWILRTAAENEEYLNSKLIEAGKVIKLDTEAPEETDTLEQDIMNLDSSSETPEETSTPTDTTELPSIDVPTELLDAPEDSSTSSEDTVAPTDVTDTAEIPAGSETNSEDVTDTTDTKPVFQTSLEGVGLLPLLAEIQDKLANGKPSEVELAALKAMKKLF